MSIFRETSITWDGKSYEFVPSLSFLRRLERGRPGEGSVSIVRIQNNLLSGETNVPVMCQIITEVMQHAGVTGVTDEDIYQAAMTDGTTAFIALWHEIYAAFSPVPKDQKKADAPEKR